MSSIQNEKLDQGTIVLLIDGNRGIHIPRKFRTNFDFKAWNLNPDDFQELESIDHPHYWDAWDDLMKAAYFTDDKGKKWSLYQDDDLFAVSENHVWDEGDQTNE